MRYDEFFITLLICAYLEEVGSWLDSPYTFNKCKVPDSASSINLCSKITRINFDIFFDDMLLKKDESHNIDVNYRNKMLQYLRAFMSSTNWTTFSAETIKLTLIRNMQERDALINANIKTVEDLMTEVEKVKQWSTTGKDGINLAKAFEQYIEKVIKTDSSNVQRMLLVLTRGFSGSETWTGKDHQRTGDLEKLYKTSATNFFNKTQKNKIFLICFDYTKDHLGAMECHGPSKVFGEWADYDANVKTYDLLTDEFDPNFDNIARHQAQCLCNAVDDCQVKYKDEDCHWKNVNNNGKCEKIVKTEVLKEQTTGYKKDVPGLSCPSEKLTTNCTVSECEADCDKMWVSWEECDLGTKRGIRKKGDSQSDFVPDLCGEVVFDACPTDVGVTTTEMEQVTNIPILTIIGGVLIGVAGVTLLVMAIIVVVLKCVPIVKERRKRARANRRPPSPRRRKSPPKKRKPSEKQRRRR